MIHLKWSLCRLYFYVFGFLSMITFGLATFLLAPITSYYLFGNLNLRRNYRYFFPFTIFIWRTCYTWLTGRDYRDMFRLPLTAPPQTTPDNTVVKLSSSWDDEAWDCGKCAKCCLKIKCPLLDTDTGYCLSYGTVHWRYFNCGRYPCSQQQIDYYNCPKWEMVR